MGVTSVTKVHPSTIGPIIIIYMGNVPYNVGSTVLRYYMIYNKDSQKRKKRTKAIL